MIQYSKEKEINAIKRLSEISEKNTGKEYSLGDCLLLSLFEGKLKEIGFTKEEIENLSPSYYLNNSLL